MQPENKQLISVIIPVYNTARYLDECIRSVTMQTYDAVDIILVNDGSTDDSPGICSSWADRDHRIRVLHKENGGVSSARNAGITIAKGEYLVFVDSDDVIAPCMIEVLHKALVKQNADLSFCGFSTFPFSSDKPFSVSESIPLTQKEVFSHLYIDQDILLSAVWGKMFKKIVFDGITFPNQKKGEDNSVCFRVYQRISHAAFCPDRQYYWRSREESAVHTFDESCALDFENFDEQMDYWQEQKNRTLLRACFERSFKRLRMTLDCAGSGKESQDFRQAIKAGYEKCMRKHRNQVRGIGPIEKGLYFLDWTDGKPRPLALNYIRLKIFIRNARFLSRHKITFS